MSTIKKDYPDMSCIKHIQHTKEGLSMMLHVKKSNMLIKYFFSTDEVQFYQSF